jgi:peptide/nickel transport system permease protein
MKLDIFWTDALIYLLLTGIGFFIWYVQRHEHLRAPWRKVFQNGIAMASLLILLVYIAIGLLDSIHFRMPQGDQNNNKSLSVSTISLLDQIAMPLKKQVEKTYSAPFATHSYTKETLQNQNGPETRDYPKLKYGGAHLKDPQNESAMDIAKRAGCGILIAILIWLITSLMLTKLVSAAKRINLRAAWCAMWHRETKLPWHAVLITQAVLLLITLPVIFLCTYYHVLGTDKVGQDVLYLSLKSIRTGLVIGTLTTLVMLPFALLFGIMAGYFRGWVDDVIQYIYTTLSSIPDVLLIAAAVLMTQVFMETNPQLFPTIDKRADFRLLFLCVILGITSWTSLCRLLRGETLKIRELDYVQAAYAFGVSHWRIMTRHILPNVMHIVLITVVMSFSSLVLAEAVLSYVGVGVDPTMISFGTMINAARLEMAREPMVWWSLAAAFIFMLFLVLCANLFSDAVRDAFDPYYKSSSLLRRAKRLTPATGKTK